MVFPWDRVIFCGKTQNFSFLNLLGVIPVFCENAWMKLDSLLNPDA